MKKMIKETGIIKLSGLIFSFCFLMSHSSCNNSKKIIKPGDVYFPSYDMTRIEKAKYALKLKSRKYYVEYNYLIVFDSNKNVRLGNCYCNMPATWYQVGKYLTIILNDTSTLNRDKDSCFYYAERRFKIKGHKLLYFDNKSNSMERLELMNPVLDSVKKYYEVVFKPFVEINN